MSYVCYLLSNHAVDRSHHRSRSYVGITNNLPRRLRQHNGEIKGGAKSTRGKGPWHLYGYAYGFRSKSDALSFEWQMHHIRPHHHYSGSVAKRMLAFEVLQQRDRFSHVHFCFSSAMAEPANSHAL
jgi:predicted GIY-YIG superfamily endonuclease